VETSPVGFNPDIGASEAQSHGNVRVLVAKCFRQPCVFAHVVPQKGVDPDSSAVERLVKDLEWLGRTRIILRSNDEPAIHKLLTETLKSLRVEGFTQAAESHPPIYGPSSNGAIEVACESDGGMLRALKSDMAYGGRSQYDTRR